MTLLRDDPASAQRPKRTDYLPFPVLLMVGRDCTQQSNIGKIRPHFREEMTPHPPCQAFGRVRNRSIEEKGEGPSRVPH